MYLLKGLNFINEVKWVNQPARPIYQADWVGSTHLTQDWVRVSHFGPFNNWIGCGEVHMGSPKYDRTRLDPTQLPLPFTTTSLLFFPCHMYTASCYEERKFIVYHM